MEFREATIKGTEKYPHHIFVPGDSLYEEKLIELSDSTTYIDDDGDEYDSFDLVSEFRSEIVEHLENSTDEALIYEMLRSAHNGSDYDTLRAHLAELSGAPFIAFSPESAARITEHFNVEIINDEYDTALYIEEHIEKAKKAIARDLTLGNVAIYAIHPDALIELNLDEDTLNDVSREGVNYWAVIDRMEHQVREDIAARYIAEAHLIREDIIAYGETTAEAMYADRVFKGDAGIVRMLVEENLITPKDAGILLRRLGDNESR